MSNTSYFSHDSNARNDSKVVKLRMRHGAAGYGVYFMVLERLREECGYMSVKDYNMIAFDLRVDAALVKSVVEDFGLFAFTEDGKCFYSESFNRRMSMKDEVKAKRAEAGKKGVLMREQHKKELSETDANASENGSKGQGLLSETDANASENGSKERKEKKRKENNISPPPPPARASDEDRGQHDSYGQLRSDIRQSLTKESEWRETIWMRYKINDRQQYGKLLRDFYDECVCQGKLLHTSEADLRSHFSNWLRKTRTVATSGGDRNPQAQKVAVIPTEEELAEDERRKADEERRRVVGIYEGARKGNKRFAAIVTEWAKNGTLSLYGLEPLKQED